MKIQLFAGKPENVVARRALFSAYFKAVVVAMILMPCVAFADNEACTNVLQSMTTVQSLLKAISVIVVTIAVIFAGYQIAFAHKRISEVAPVLIGAVLIGAAAAVATMFITTSGC